MYKYPIGTILLRLLLLRTHVHLVPYGIYFTFLAAVITDITAQCLMYCTVIHHCFICCPSGIEPRTVAIFAICIDTVTVWRSNHSVRSHPSLSVCFQHFFSFPRVCVKWGCQAATAASSSWFSSSTSFSGSSVSVSSLSGKIGKWGSGSALDLLS